ncbi:hypothetical protein WA158_006374 [Blastocystis sp. Blastoise]
MQNYNKNTNKGTPSQDNNKCNEFISFFHYKYKFHFVLVSANTVYTQKDHNSIQNGYPYMAPNQYTYDNPQVMVPNPELPYYQYYKASKENPMPNQVRSMYPNEIPPSIYPVLGQNNPYLQYNPYVQMMLQNNPRAGDTTRLPDAQIFSAPNAYPYPYNTDPVLNAQLMNFYYSYPGFFAGKQPGLDPQAYEKYIMAMSAQQKDPNMRMMMSPNEPFFDPTMMANHVMVPNIKSAVFDPSNTPSKNMMSPSLSTNSQTKRKADSTVDKNAKQSKMSSDDNIENQIASILCQLGGKSDSTPNTTSIPSTNTSILPRTIPTSTNTIPLPSSISTNLSPPMLSNDIQKGMYLTIAKPNLVPTTSTTSSSIPLIESTINTNNTPINSSSISMSTRSHANSINGSIVQQHLSTQLQSPKILPKAVEYKPRNEHYHESLHIHCPSCHRRNPLKSIDSPKMIKCCTCGQVFSVIKKYIHGCLPGENIDPDDTSLELPCLRRCKDPVIRQKRLYDHYNTIINGRRCEQSTRIREIQKVMTSLLNKVEKCVSKEQKHITDECSSFLNHLVCSVDQYRSGTLYCKCFTPYFPQRHYIQCDICDFWYHTSCVGIDSRKTSLIVEFVCPWCERKTGKLTQYEQQGEGNTSQRPPSQCPLCNRYFPRPCNLSRHLHARHKMKWSTHMILHMDVDNYLKQECFIPDEEEKEVEEEETEETEETEEEEGIKEEIEKPIENSNVKEEKSITDTVLDEKKDKNIDIDIVKENNENEIITIKKETVPVKREELSKDKNTSLSNIAVNKNKSNTNNNKKACPCGLPCNHSTPTHGQGILTGICRCGKPLSQCEVINCTSKDIKKERKSIDNTTNNKENNNNTIVTVTTTMVPTESPSSTPVSNSNSCGNTPSEIEEDTDLEIEVNNHGNGVNSSDSLSKDTDKKVPLTKSNTRYLLRKLRSKPRQWWINKTLKVYKGREGYKEGVIRTIRPRNEMVIRYTDGTTETLINLYDLKYNIKLPILQGTYELELAHAIPYPIHRDPEIDLNLFVKGKI